MTNQSGCDNLINALKLVDRTNDISLLFDQLSISAIFEQSNNLAEDEANIDIYMPILLKHFDNLYEETKNKTEAGNLLLSILARTSDGITYKDAQVATLGCASDWDDTTSKSFFRLFQANYLRQKDEDQYHFIAALSLEGLVMLPIIRGDNKLFVGALGSLLNDFPDIPADPEASADLAIKALKLLGRCYDFHPQMAEIAEKVQECIGVNNIAVDTEARFYRGMISLYDAFLSSDGDSLKHKLGEARDSFEEAKHGHENRSDAELFYSITNCYLMVMSKHQPFEVETAIRSSQVLLIERLLLSGEKASYYRVETEYHMVKLINWLGKWLEEISSAKTWPNIIPPMHLLANVYAAIRRMDILSGIIKTASQSVIDLILLPDMQGRFIQVQEMTSKIEQVLSNATWRNQATVDEIEFYEIAQNVLNGSISPKGEAAAALKPLKNRLLAA